MQGEGGAVVDPGCEVGDQSRMVGERLRRVGEGARWVGEAILWVGDGPRKRESDREAAREPPAVVVLGCRRDCNPRSTLFAGVALGTGCKSVAAIPLGCAYHSGIPLRASIGKASSGESGSVVGGEGVERFSGNALVANSDSDSEKSFHTLGA
jgi:hypothetical protein